MQDAIVFIGAGQIGQAIARRVGVGKQVLLADVREENATAAAEVLGNAGYGATVATVDASHACRCMRSSSWRRVWATSPASFTRRVFRPPRRRRQRSSKWI